MQELADVLGREHVQLEFLLFKILELQHQLRSGDSRFLRWAGEELLRASRQVQVTELSRQRHVRELALRQGLPSVSETSLATLAKGAPEPWRTIFDDHLQGIRTLISELDSVVSLTSALAKSHGHAVAGVLQEMHRPVTALAAGDVIDTDISTNISSNIDTDISTDISTDTMVLP